MLVLGAPGVVAMHKRVLVNKCIVNVTELCRRDMYQHCTYTSSNWSFLSIGLRASEERK